jgi:non-specific serine/threonine protein kinase
LFAERAAAVRGDFQLTQKNVADVRAICQRMDGIPLAIELAAARSDALSPPSLRALLEARLMLLTGGAQDAPARHHTMQQAITWSSDLLTPKERRTFARLAVFGGGFGLGDAAAVVAEGTSLPHVLETLLTLLEQSLIVPDAMHRIDLEPRFFMLETIREVALGQLVASGEEEQTRQRHAERFRQVAAQAKLELNGFQQREWMERLERDIHNIRSALSWAIAAGQGELALGLGGDLLMFWLKRAHVAEGRAWLERALALPPDQASPVRLNALVASCVMAGPSGDLPRAAEALVMAQALGDRAAEGRLRMLHGSPILTTQPEAAREHFVQALALHEAVDDQPWRAVALMMLGLAEGRLGHPEQALGYLEAAISVSDEVGDLWVQLLARQATGTIARLAGHHAEAAALAVSCLEATLELGDGVSANEALVGFAGVLLDLGHVHRAAQMFGAAEVLRESAGISPRHLLVAGQYEQDVAAASASLGNEAFLEAWREGRAIPQANLVRRAREMLPPAQVTAIPRRLDGPPRHAQLTARELDVLRLLAERRTDREISQILFIGLRTVEFHVANILSKLDAPNRYEAATIAARLGVL